jgi:hypothetical protein
VRDRALDAFPQRRRTDGDDARVPAVVADENQNASAVIADGAGRRLRTSDAPHDRPLQPARQRVRREAAVDLDRDGPLTRNARRHIARTRDFSVRVKPARGKAAALRARRGSLGRRAARTDGRHGEVQRAIPRFRERAAIGLRELRRDDGDARCLLHAVEPPA